MALTRYIRGAHYPCGGYYLNSAANDGNGRGWKVKLTFRLTDAVLRDEYILQANTSNTGGQWTIKLVRQSENNFKVNVITVYEGNTWTTTSSDEWTLEDNKWYTFSFSAEAFVESDEIRYVYVYLVPYGATGTEVSWKHSYRYSTVGGSKSRTIQLGNDGMDLADRFTVVGSSAGTYSSIYTLSFDIENFIIGTSQRYSNATYLYIDAMAYALAATLEAVNYNLDWKYNEDCTINLTCSGLESSYQYYLSCKFRSNDKLLTSDVLQPTFESNNAKVTLLASKINQLYTATSNNQIDIDWELVTKDADGKDQGTSTKTGSANLVSAQELYSIQVFSPTEILSLYTYDENNKKIFFKTSGNYVGLEFSTTSYCGRDTKVTVNWNAKDYVYSFNKTTLSGTLYLPLSENMPNTLGLTYSFYNGSAYEYKTLEDIQLKDLPLPQLKSDGELKMCFGNMIDEEFVEKPFGRDVKLYNETGYSNLKSCVEFPSGTTYYWGEDTGITPEFWYDGKWEITRDNTWITGSASEPAASDTSIPLYLTDAEKQQTYVFTLTYTPYVQNSPSESSTKITLTPTTLCTVVLTPTSYTMSARLDKQGLSFGGPAPKEPGYVNCYWKLRLYDEETDSFKLITETTQVKPIPVYVIDRLF